MVSLTEFFTPTQQKHLRTKDFSFRSVFMETERKQSNLSSCFHSFQFWVSPTARWIPGSCALAETPLQHKMPPGMISYQWLLGVWNAYVSWLFAFGILVISPGLDLGWPYRWFSSSRNEIPIEAMVLILMKTHGRRPSHHPTTQIGQN